MAKTDSGEASQCALCRRSRTLRLSHIVPAFAGRYLKETSSTGYLRSMVNPNLRRQDLGKRFLLCGECEELFSGWETVFSTEAFPKLQDDDFTELAYGAWFLKFAVSLTWRTLVSEKSPLLHDFPQFRQKVETTLENWRLFLLGERKKPGTEHHLFVIAGIPEKLPPDLHPKFLHYLLRSIDATEAVSARTLAVYVKMLRLFFYAPITPAFPSGWKNTRIHPGNARLISPQVVAMRGFFDLLKSRAEEALARPVSAAQADKIRQAMLKDPQRVLNSESMKVQLASEYLIERPPPRGREDGAAAGAKGRR